MALFLYGGNMLQIIDSIDYKNAKKNVDFEIVELSLFLSSTPAAILKREYRMNFWNILYITEGSGTHYVDFVEYSYNKGDVIFIQKNQVQKFGDYDNVKGYMLHINEPFFYQFPRLNMNVFFEFLDDFCDSPRLHFDISEGRTNRLLVELMYNEYNKFTNQDDNMELLSSIFQSFILALKMQMPHNEQTSYKAKEYELFKEYRTLVEKYYTEFRAVDDYANMLHVSKKTINGAVKSVSGMTAKQFIINRILLEIKRYLSQGELMNYEIADILGFDAAANMTKFFKHYEGLSPKEFKEQL